MNYWFVLQIPIFIIACYFSLIVVGSWLLNKSKIEFHFLEKFFLSGVIGFILLTLIVYFSFLINIWWLPIILVFIINFFYFYPSQSIHKLKNIKLKKINILLMLIFSLGIIGQMAVITPSGSLVNGDLLFWSAHGHDGVWHIALIEELKKSYPWQNPAFAGEKLVNYHFFSDLLSAFFSKLFIFSPVDLYFKFFPFVYSLWLGLGSFVVGEKLGGKKCAFWAVFFTYFSGSLGFIITWIKEGRIGGETIFWSSQVQSSSGNPPQIVALIIVLAIYLLISTYQKTRNLVIFVLLLLMIGTLIEFKVYGAILVLLSLGIISLINLIKDKKLDFLLLTISSLILSAILFFPNSAGIGNFLIWEPGWFIRTMIVSEDKLNWMDLELRKQTYLYYNNYKWVVLYWILGLTLFLIGNLGTKVLGVFYFLQTKKYINNFGNIFLFLFPIASFTLPLLFLQKGVAGNTIQFVQYGLLVMGIFSAVMIAKLSDKIKNIYLKILILVLIIMVSIPTQIGLMHEFYSRPAFARVSNSEIQALYFIRKYSPPESVILSPPFNKYLNLNQKTPHIWTWSDSSYIPALSARRTFISDIEQLDIMGYDYPKRRDIQTEIFNTEDPLKFKNLINQNNIKLIYINNFQQRPKVNLSAAGLIKIFENGLVEIWQTN